MHNPDVRASNPANRPSLLHVFSAAMQNIPVVLAVSQSADPQRQLPSLADVPSAMLHDAVGREQLLDTAVQTRPVPVPRPLLVQSLLPHAQADGLAAEPSVMAQIGRHLFWDT